jgi:hypothetical protein
MKCTTFYVVNRLKKGKSPGIDEITREMIQAAGEK